MIVFELLAAGAAGAVGAAGLPDTHELLAHTALAWQRRVRVQHLQLLHICDLLCVDACLLESAVKNGLDISDTVNFMARLRMLELTKTKISNLERSKFITIYKPLIFESDIEPTSQMTQLFVAFDALLVSHKVIGNK